MVSRTEVIPNAMNTFLSFFWNLLEFPELIVGLARLPFRFVNFLKGFGQLTCWLFKVPQTGHAESFRIQLQLKEVL